MRERSSLFGPEVLRHHDARADGDPHEQHQQQIEYRAGASDRRQSVVSYVFAYDNAVNCVVQLLEYISY